jgi:hypothetical protein
MHPTPDELLKAHLPHSFRGFEESATADLIERAAAALTDALAQRDALQAKIKELEGRVAHPGRPDPDDVLQVGSALMTAHRLSERLLAETREKIAALDEEAAAQRRALLESSQKEIASTRAEAAARVEEARAKETHLRALIDRHRSELTKLVRQALDHLIANADQAPPGAPRLDAELRERLAQMNNGEVGAQSSELGASRVTRPDA